MSHILDLRKSNQADLRTGCRRLLVNLLMLLFAAGLVGCRSLTIGSMPHSDLQQLRPKAPRVLNQCLALPGNGPLIAAHFGALARLTELHGVFNAGAGGGSASITLFLYESMLANPAVYQCGPGSAMNSRSLAV